MKVSQRVIEILNQDETAKKLHTAFNEAAERQGLTGTEYNKAKETFLMMIISRNPEAMKAMATEVYNYHNQL